MCENAIRCGLIFCTLLTILCASSPSEARRWRYYHQDYRYSDQPVANDRTQDSRLSALGARGTEFGPTMDQLIRGCSQQAAELKNWPFDFLAQLIGADETQRNAVQQMQSSVADASDTRALVHMQFDLGQGSAAPSRAALGVSPEPQLVVLMRGSAWRLRSYAATRRGTNILVPVANRDTRSQKVCPACTAA